MLHVRRNRIVRFSVIAGFDKESRVLDPCLPKDHKEETKVQFSVEKMNASDAVKAQLRDRDTIFLTGTGDWNKCFSSIKIFTKQAEKFSTCEEETTCHDTGIRVPVIPFEKAEFYGFSEFWYSMEDVLRMGGQYSYSTYRKAAEVMKDITYLRHWEQPRWNFEFLILNS